MTECCPKCYFPLRDKELRHCGNYLCPCHKVKASLPEQEMGWEKKWDERHSEWIKAYDEMTGVEYVGLHPTYTKHTDLQSVKGFIIMTLTTALASQKAQESERVRLLVEGMKLDLREYFDPSEWNEALDKVLSALKESA